MGLRCSLLGHDYGDSFVERDREERGDEVVVTERELKECARCGAENVTAENTEVRSLRAGSDATDERSEQAGQPGGTRTDPESATGDATADAADADDGASGSAFSSPGDAIEQAEADAAPAGGAVSADADGEDAVILDDDADDAPGSDQWDEHEDVDPEAPAPDPAPSPAEEDVEFVGSATSDAADAAGAEDRATEAAGQSGTDDAASRSDGAEAASQSGSTGAASQSDRRADAGAAARAGGASGGAGDRARGEWPEREDVDDDGVDAAASTDDAASTFEFGDEDVVEADTGFTSAGPLETADRAEADDLDFTLFCPECGLERYAGGSSLRAGDICPECRKGYLAEDR
ncbi:DUF7093 family protein [Halobacterium yunchengense]|uniref:DUF7093 family protein n=1 Tax=Halobacterium yunchengense TaxID=3108497 RepID=UPI003009F580